ncbi:transglutaminase domain-containing protein [Algibacter sp. 2305UL17-15]|uniref:transglutaminase domain-containing protein n=1 Tax=Algibacter sp. 2305UL17-15 TaxID=3231268 RepID=UPI003459A8AD
MKLFLYIFFLFLSSTIEAQKSDFKYINFEKADSIANLYKGERLCNLPLLAYKLSNNLNTQVEKFRAIHTWVCSNIESDHGFSEKTIRKRKKFKNDSIAFSNWNTQVEAWVFDRLLKDKKTICSGYAYLLKELASLADIECVIVNGYSRTVNTNVEAIDIPNHSWNAVKLNNKWYLVDATLASGYFYINENIFVKNYNDGYFLASPELFSKNHYPLDKKWLLLNDTLTINEFVKAPLIYGTTYKFGVMPILPEKLVTQISVHEEVLFSLKTSYNMETDKICLFINKGFKNEKIKVLNPEDKNNHKFKYRFSKKGNYDVHIKINNDVVVSYTIIVAKPKKSIL